MTQSDLDYPGAPLRRRIGISRLILLPCLAIVAAYAPPCHAQTPQITSVSPIAPLQHQTIVITGSGFGTLAPYTGNSSYISVGDLTKVWDAGYATDDVTLIVVSWTDTQIELGGFGGAWGSDGWTLDVGDQEHIRIWNAQSGNGPASVTTSVLASTPLRFVSMTPCRVADTRVSSKPAGFGPPFLTGGSSRSFMMPEGRCGIPVTAQAYALNVTVIPHGDLGYLTIWPTGSTQPLVSTLNSLDGRVKANAAIVPAGTAGAVSVFVTDDTDMALDINGYFVPASESGGLGFYPMTPCRLVDTRLHAPSTIVSGTLAAGSTTTLPILSSSSCHVPATAQAYSLNVTVVPPADVGYLTLYPVGEGRPTVSTLNDPTGTVVANAAIEPAGTGGSIDVYVTDATHLLVDINGYFAPAGGGSLSLYTLPPCRVLDTRLPIGTPPFVGTINVDVSGSACGGSAVEAYVFNATVVPEGFLGYLTLWPEGSAQPVVSTLNAYDGDITSNMAIVPTSNTQISAYANYQTHLVLDISGYFAP